MDSSGRGRAQSFMRTRADRGHLDATLRRTRRDAPPRAHHRSDCNAPEGQMTPR